VNGASPTIPVFTPGPDLSIHRISMLPNERERRSVKGSRTRARAYPLVRPSDILIPCLTVADKRDQLAKHVDYNASTRRAGEVGCKENPNIIGCDWMLGYRDSDSRSTYGVEL